VHYKAANANSTSKDHYFIRNKPEPGGLNMKQIFWIMAMLLIWAGPVNAGVLKVMVPIDEFEQMDSRIEALERENRQLQKEVESSGGSKMSPQLDALEQENSQLRQQVRSLAGKSSDIEIESQLDTLEQENNRLRQQVESLAGNSSEKEMGYQLDALEQENNRLKQQIESLAGKSSEESASAKGMDARLDALGRENRRLKRSVASLKDARAILRSDKRTAQQVYFKTKKNLAVHIYK
jgi:chromosome segregation ATPase